MIDSALPDNRRITAWLCLCPLLAITMTWRIALVLSVCLLVTIVLTAAGLALLRRYTQQALRLPLAALISGTIAVLLHLVMAASPFGSIQSVNAEIAPWLMLVAGLAVLVCCAEDETPSRPERSSVIHSLKLAVALSAALLLIGVARDGFGRAFLLANTSIGALMLLALTVASWNALRSPKRS